jgi:hypothetical protein
MEHLARAPRVRHILSGLLAAAGPGIATRSAIACLVLIRAFGNSF